jgi:hypothetical protein
MDRKRPGGRDDPVSMDGRVLRGVETDGDGEVGGETTFHFDQDGDLVHARYAGGSVRLGHLVGTTRGRELSFRYAQVNTDGETATGHSEDRIELLEDGRVRLHETWAWDSRAGSGTSVLEEVEGETG